MQKNSFHIEHVPEEKFLPALIQQSTSETDYGAR
jgi:hypothetical protein